MQGGITMTVLDAIKARHSVRRYQDIPLDPISTAQLQHDIEQCNEKYNLSIQLITEEPNAFSTLMGKLGKFSGVLNYIALVGAKNDPALHEKLGWCGEKLVLKAQCLGLNTCWVYMTYSKRKASIQIGPGEKLVCVIALGYGETRGKAPKRQSTASLLTAPEPIPDWFIRGVKAARRAPTAMNRQNFHFTLLDDNKVHLESKGSCAKLNAGILKYHFEAGAGIESFTWV